MNLKDCYKASKWFCENHLDDKLVEAYSVCSGIDKYYLSIHDAVIGFGYIEDATFPDMVKIASIQ